MQRFLIKDRQMLIPPSEKGAALIIVVIVLSFLLTVGLVLMTVTATGPKVAGNMRIQQQAFNAAEAGFDAAWASMVNSFDTEGWANFMGHYLTYPAGIDDPVNVNYFRKLTDQEILNYIDPDGDGTPVAGAEVLFCRERYINTGGAGLDPKYTYTAFLIDDEAGGGTPDSWDAILVCIGTVVTGEIVTTTRLEIELVTQRPGT